MSYISRFKEAVAAVFLSVCAVTAHADGAAGIGLQISPEPYFMMDSIGSGENFGGVIASLEIESQQAIDLLTQQLTAFEAVPSSQFNAALYGEVFSRDYANEPFLADTSIIQLATLETESSKAIEDMRRLLQQGQLPSNAPSSGWDMLPYGYGAVMVEGL